MNEDEEEEEDDYMSMTFADAPAAPETSLQRRERLKREGLRRGLVPSKAELAAQERARREEGLSRSLIPDRLPKGVTAAKPPAPPSAATAARDKIQLRDNTTSKGLAMMAKMGFRPGTALGAAAGAAGGAALEPLRIEVREDRGGLGLEGERKRKLREAAAAAAGVDAAGEEGEEGVGSNKRPKVDEGDYRERMARERDAERKEKLVRAAQKIAERMDEDHARGGQGRESKGEGEQGVRSKATNTTSSSSSSSRPLRSLPVLYRGLVRGREAAERDRRMRHDLEVSSSAAKMRTLPTYEDETMDADDRLALGLEPRGEDDEEEGGDEEFAGGKKDKRKKNKAATVVYEAADDLDEEDAELEAFEALVPGERLERLVGYLRERYRYCFWCKFAYPDEAMEGCPGATEEDHD